jgi:hypothetical protein
MKTILSTPPTFVPASRTLDFSSTPSFALRNLLAVINLTRSAIIFAAGVTGKGYSSFASNVLTLTFDTTTHNAADVLTCIYEDTTAVATSANQATANTALANILAKIIAAPATEANQATEITRLTEIRDKLIAAPATEATLGNVVTAINSLISELQLKADLTETQPVSVTSLPIGLATSARQDTIITALADILAKIIASPATEATLAALNAKVPAAGQALMAASQPVAIASNQSPVPTEERALIQAGAAAQTAVVNNILTNPSGAAGLDVSNLRSASVQIVSTGTGGTFIFEQSNDGTNWVALPVFNAALVTGVPITGAITASASAIIYTFPVRCQFIRCRIATTITGGAIRAFSRLSSEPWTAAAQLVASNTAANLLTQVSGSVTSTLGAATVRAAFIAAAAIWFDDSSTNLGISATFTGTSRDLTVTATATAMANAATYAQELVVSAESDVSGTLWLEVSRDNTNWRRVKSVPTAAITGGGQYAEIVHRPSWRYARVGFTNGGVAQTRFSIGSILKAI